MLCISLGTVRGRVRPALAMLLWLAVATGRTPAVHAQETPPSAATPTATAEGPADDLRRGVPRSAVRGYLEACWARDYERAAQYLDLRRVPHASRDAQGATLAQHLCTVIDRTLWIDPELLSGVKEGAQEDGLPPRRDLVGTIQTAKAPVQLLVERVPREDGTLIWKISSTNVAQVPELYQEFSYGSLVERLPAFFHETRFLQLQLFQWIGFLFLLVTVVPVSWALAHLMLWVLRTLAARTRTRVDDALVTHTAGPLQLTVAVLLFYVGTLLLAFTARARALVDIGSQILALVAFTWVLLRVIDFLARVAEERYLGPRRHIAALVPLCRRTAKAFVVILAVLATVQNLGYNVTSLLAGLGIGGLAVALAAQKTVEHVFGSVTLVTDAPVRVGDFCRFGDYTGTVEDIGLRSTRVRSLDRTIISIPNGELASMKIENFSKRDRIRFHVTLGLRYETSPDQLRFVLVELKRLLLSHPKVDPIPARARFIGLGAYSLDVEIFAFIMTTDPEEFLAIREDLLLRIMELIAAAGTGFAFPSQTTYVAQDSAFDTTKSRAAEEQVRAWRAANALCLPDVPAGQASALRGQLRYPPEGAAR